MADDEEGESQAEDDFQRFPRRHAQSLAAIEAFKGKHEVDKQRSIEQDRARPAAPDHIENPARVFHGFDGNQPERVV